MNKGEAISTDILLNLIMFELGVKMEKKIIVKEYHDDLIYFSNKKKWKKPKKAKIKLEDFVS